MRSKQLNILLWSSNLWLLSDGLLGPALALFGKKVGGDLMEISVAVFIYWAVNGTVEIIVGRYCRNPGTMRYIMLTGFILNTVATFSFLAVKTMAGVLLIQTAIGISRGLSGPTWDALYQLSNSSQTNVADAWGRARGMGSWSMAISVILCGYAVGPEEAYDRAFLIMGTIQTIATLFLSSIVWYRMADETRYEV